MNRFILGTLVGSFMLTTGVSAQTVFWGFDENNNETYIPAQCDGQFDETNGGVFMPSPEDLFEQGEAFLLEKGSTRANAAYCLLSSAIQGNVKAQYRVAQLYNKGLVLPQNDIVAYRWAFLAALGGSKEAEQLALTLEQLLTAEEIQMATKTVEPMLPDLKSAKDSDLQKQEELLTSKKAELEELNKEIDELLGVNYKQPQIKSIDEIRAAARARMEKQKAEEDKLIEEYNKAEAAEKAKAEQVKSAQEPSKETNKKVEEKKERKPLRRRRGKKSDETPIFDESDRMKK